MNYSCFLIIFIAICPFFTSRCVFQHRLTMSFKKTLKKITTNRDSNKGIDRSISAYRRPIPHPESIKELVGDALSQPHSKLKNIIKTLESKHKQKDIILKTIPENYRSGVTDFNLTHNKLCLLTQNAGVATQLRYIKTDILDELRKEGLWEIISIDIKVKP